MTVYKKIFFGEKIEAARKQRNLSRVELGKAIGCSEALIWDIENNVSNTAFSSIHAVANELNLSLDYLVGNIETNIGISDRLRRSK